MKSGSIAVPPQTLSAKRVVVCDPDAVPVIREFLEPLGFTVEFAPEEDLVPADPHLV